MPLITTVTVKHYLYFGISIEQVQELITKMRETYALDSIRFRLKKEFSDQWDQEGSWVAYFECTRLMTPEELVRQQAREESTRAEKLERRRQEFLRLKEEFEPKESP